MYLSPIYVYVHVTFPTLCSDSIIYISMHDRSPVNFQSSIIPGMLWRQLCTTFYQGEAVRASYLSRVVCNIILVSYDYHLHEAFISFLCLSDICFWCIVENETN